MDLVIENMEIIGNLAKISRFEVIRALFRSEERNDELIHDSLNELYNMFCEQEYNHRKNITELELEIDESNIKLLEYISKMQSLKTD